MADSHLIEHMLSAVESDLDHKNQRNDFIESIRDQFERRGSLTQKQLEALENFYERI
jgi:hypothetical protein